MSDKMAAEDSLRALWYKLCAHSLDDRDLEHAEAQALNKAHGDLRYLIRLARGVVEACDDGHDCASGSLLMHEIHALRDHLGEPPC